MSFFFSSPESFFAVMVNFLLPFFVGVPVIRPEWFILSPSGSFPFRVQVNGGVPDTPGWYAYAVPATAGLSVGGLGAGGRLCNCERQGTGVRAVVV